MWQESGKPQNGVIYSGMKRTRHQYHYACVAVKKQNLEFQKQKIAENISDSNKFWREVKRLKTTSKAIANCIDEANGAEEISNVFYEKYRMPYNSVPTDAHELDDLHNTVEKVHLGCRLNVALIIRKGKLLRSLRNVGPSADHRLTINMPNTASY